MMNEADQMIPDALKTVGIVGIPPFAVIRALADQKVTIHDLDTPLLTIDIESTVAHVPRVYCAILRTVVQNALHLALDAIYFDVGPGKCDNALYVAEVLDDLLDIPVIRTRNQDLRGHGTPICDSSLPLTDKMLRITEGVKTCSPAIPPPRSRATAGFWGVPPRDFSILSLFPDTTHIYGWSRCMENRTPADIELELRFDPRIPTVFYAQSFCGKTALAQMLARKHPHSLYLDSDVQAGGSAKAKIQAFLELSGAFA